jgi:hypothetical protein
VLTQEHPDDNEGFRHISICVLHGLISFGSLI